VPRKSLDTREDLPKESRRQVALGHMKYLSEIDLFLLSWRRAAKQGRLMIRLSDMKVRLQYRWRVRQRLMVLHFARLHGPTAAGRRFGVSVRTIRRWRVRWRQDALQGLGPRYPRHRGRRITPRVVELIAQARRELEYGAQRT
jgi:Homeodomain-like domain